MSCSLDVGGLLELESNYVKPVQYQQDHMQCSAKLSAVALPLATLALANSSSATRYQLCQ